MKISDSKYGVIISMPGMFLLGLLAAFPLVILIALCFLRYDFITPVVFWGLNNFIKVLSSRLFWLALKNTIIYSAGTTTITVITGLVLAICSARVTKFKTFFRTLAIIPWAVPLVVSGLLWRWMLDPGVGVINYLMVQIGLSSEPINIFGDRTFAMIATMIGYAWVSIPFTFVIILAGIESIPRELYEAARVDGAHMIQTFKYITLPLAKKSILFATLITSMFSFRTIDAIWSMTRGGPARATYVLGIQLVEFVTEYHNLGFSAAIAIIMLALITSFVGVILYYLTKE